jgi:hypothetical protein
MFQDHPILLFSVLLVEMVSEIVVYGRAQIDIIGHAPGDLSFISAIFFPAELLEDKTVIRPMLTCMACRLLATVHCS